MKQNNYLIDKKLGKYHVTFVCPSFHPVSNSMGLYWNLGISLSIGGGYEDFNLHIGFILGWFQLTKYKK